MEMIFIFVLSLIALILTLEIRYLSKRIKKLEELYCDSFKSILKNNLDIKNLYEMFNIQVEINDEIRNCVTKKTTTKAKKEKNNEK